MPARGPPSGVGNAGILHFFVAYCDMRPGLLAGLHRLRVNTIFYCCSPWSFYSHMHELFGVLLHCTAPFVC